MRTGTGDGGRGFHGGFSAWLGHLPTAEGEPSLLQRPGLDRQPGRLVECLPSCPTTGKAHVIETRRAAFVNFRWLVDPHLPIIAL